MQLYELSYLLPLSSKGQEAQKTATDIEALIQSKDGILTQGRRKSKIKLGYLVEGKAEALNFSCEFQMGPKRIQEIRQEIEKMPLLRVMLEKKTPRKIKKRRRRSKILDTSEKKEIKVELDEIEEKLDEILHES